MSASKRNLKEQVASQKHNSRILRKMPAPAAPSSENLSFIGARSGLSTHRNLPPRSPVLPNPPPPPSTSSATFSASNIQPINSASNENRFERSVNLPVSKNDGSGEEIVRKWPEARPPTYSFKTACDLGKPVIENSLMILLSLLFTLFTFQLLVETFSCGLFKCSEAD